MKEKKQFIIPKNYDKKFEWIPGISGWQHLAFVPVVAIDFFVIKYVPFSFSNKVTFLAISLGLPWVLMGIHPVRENVPLYKHLLWRFKFMSRQRKFKYRKEGYVHVQHIETEGEETRISESKGDSRFDSIESNGERTTNHTRQQDGSMLESVGSKSGTNK
ncbi:hypothetical protein [Peribacillus asahii]|uniref:hypothetical protein n=1 Tax=Peribacillus asahii TaxID=228899 RepID=UPI00207A4EA9|nr:hypothetical protein [Peribacillus asahii]USK72638.1 hypothetical protein LIS76_23625 [Peribacillus asahii]USK72754.1 hypothetical protein LIS76_23805 [Peribacillus asahii]